MVKRPQLGVCLECFYVDDVGDYIISPLWRKRATQFIRHPSCCLLGSLIAHVQQLSKKKGKTKELPTRPFECGLDETMEPSLEHLQIFASQETFTNLRRSLSKQSGPARRVLRDLSLIRPVDIGKVDIQLIKSWFTLCERKHLHKMPIADPIKESEQALLLVDVKRGCLVQAPFDSRYITLSYVWGGMTQFHTMSENLENLKIPGALKGADILLSQTIGDAMDLVQRLGERYLWVDSLCIIQDDEVQKHTQISQMALIYERAVLTIVSLSGKNADAGLPGLRPNSRVGATEIAPGIHLARRYPNLSERVASSVYDTRAWTYQERLLSKRCLYFSDSMVYFQCEAGTCCEDRAAKFTNQDIDRIHPLSSLSYGNTFHRKLETEGLASMFQCYSQAVVDYSRKNLSFESDIVGAFDGIAQKFSKIFLWKFEFCLPREVMHLALLWASSTGPMKIREVTTSRSYRDLKLPSWSWTAWKGPVDYNMSRKTHYARSDMGDLQIFKNANHQTILQFDTEILPLTDVFILNAINGSYELDGHLTRSINIQEQTSIMHNGHFHGKLYGLKGVNKGATGKSRIVFARIASSDTSQVARGSRYVFGLLLSVKDQEARRITSFCIEAEKWDAEMKSTGSRKSLSLV